MIRKRPEIKKEQITLEDREIIINKIECTPHQLRRVLNTAYLLAVSDDGYIYVDVERAPLVDSILDKKCYDIIGSGDGRWAYKKKAVGMFGNVTGKEMEDFCRECKDDFVECDGCPYIEYCDNNFLAPRNLFNMAETDKYWGDMPVGTVGWYHNQRCTHCHQEMPKVEVSFDNDPDIFFEASCSRAHLHKKSSEDPTFLNFSEDHNGNINTIRCPVCHHEYPFEEKEAEIPFLTYEYFINKTIAKDADNSADDADGGQEE